MDIIAGLVGLALMDSTSIGTLVLPLLIIVLARKVDWASLGFYLSVVAGLYFLIGIVLLTGAGVAKEAFSDALESKPAYVAQLILGVALFILSFRIGRDGKNASEQRVNRLVERATGSPAALASLALTAVLMEIATMIPYLGAIGLLTASDWSWPARFGVLAGYCLVMLLPVLVIMVLASLFGNRLWGRIERFSRWIARETEETMAWIIGIVGFFLAAGAIPVVFGLN